MLMRRSFWLDEAATQYFVAGNWSDLWSRLSLHPQMSPGYYVVLKAIGPMWLRGEPGFRWLSLAALAGACLLLHRLGSRLFGAGPAVNAAIIFAVLPNIARQAVNARPYALGILCVVGAAWLLVRWLDERCAWDAVGFTLASAAAVWVHFTMSVILIVFAAYAYHRHRSDAQTARGAIGVAVAVSMLILPLLLRMTLTWYSATSLSFTSPPTSLDLAEVLILPFVLIVSALLLGRFERKTGSPPVSSSTWVLVLGWAFGPPSILFVLGRWTSAQVFVDRYLLAMYPAVALLAGVWLQRFDSVVIRRVLLAAVVLACATVTLRTPAEDWRGALHEARSLDLGPSTPIFLSAGFVEARDPEVLGDSRYEPYLSSPLVSYPVPGKIVLLPDATDSRDELTIRQLIQGELTQSRRVLLISRGFHPIVDWARAQMVEQGFTWRELGPFEGVRAALAERQKVTPLAPASTRP